MENIGSELKKFRDLGFTRDVFPEDKAYLIPHVENLTKDGWCEKAMPFMMRKLSPSHVCLITCVVLCHFPEIFDKEYNFHTEIELFEEVVMEKAENHFVYLFMRYARSMYADMRPEDAAKGCRIYIQTFFEGDEDKNLILEMKGIFSNGVHA